MICEDKMWGKCVEIPTLSENPTFLHTRPRKSHTARTEKVVYRKSDSKRPTLCLHY